jgi:hypothetical protein
VDQKIPFTSYDFWAYLSAGFMLLFALDQAAGIHLLMRETWTVVQCLIAVSVAYAVGQLVASASSLLYERLLVGKILGYPSKVLFGDVSARRMVQKLLPGYFSPLPSETQRSALQKGGKVGVDKPGEALFWPAHVYGRSTPEVAARLDNFLNLYGFCRNVALVGLIDAAVLYWSYWKSNGPPEHLLWARISLVISIGMTLRYLKFYRHFALEVFTSWAFAENKEPELNKP